MGRRARTVKGDVIKVILRESNRYIPNENLSMDWYTTLAMLSATMPNVQMARLAGACVIVAAESGDRLIAFVDVHCLHNLQIVVK